MLLLYPQSYIINQLKLNVGEALIPFKRYELQPSVVEVITISEEYYE